MGEPRILMKPSMVLYGNAFRRTFVLDGIHYKLEYHLQYLALIRVLMSLLMFLKKPSMSAGFFTEEFVPNVTP